MAKKKGFVLGCTALLSLLSIVGCAPTNSDSSSSGSASSSSSSSSGTAVKANGAFNYVASSYDERAKITGLLEGWALKNHLTGLTLYGDGGYSVASSRLNYPYKDYVTGYGFGLARYGSINTNDSNFQISDSDTSIDNIKEFYHSYDSTPITTLNALDSDGSQVSDYWSYFESALFGERIKNDDTSASTLETEWYPILAKTMPVAVNKDSTTGLASKWRFQVRTGSDGITYKTESSLRSKWNGTAISAKDYIYALKVLLTKKVGYYRASQYTSGSAEIVGASAYYNASSTGMDSPTATAAWNNVGFKLVNEDGSSWSGDESKAFIEVEYVTPCNEFNSYYRLSDALTTPINEDFYKEVCGTGESFTPANYANQSSDKTTTAADNVLSVGPYTLKRIDGTNNGDIVFVRNDDWFETKANSRLYQIKGYKFRFDTNLNQDALAAISHFRAKECDSSSIPSSVWNEFSSDSGSYWVKKLSGNSSTYKMNVNGCTAERWAELFGESGSIATTSKSDYWNVKPIMSNSDFLDGVYFSTNRTAIADSMHRNRASDYFSEAYMYDPETGLSFNDTQYHKDAVADYATTDSEGNNTYGYDLATAKTYFARAAKALTDAGTYKSGDTITLYTYYQAQLQIDQWGSTWATTIVDAFNDAAKPYGLTLAIKNEAVDVWYNVYYTKMMVGQFDFAFGSISGNTLDPLNFLEVLKSDNSSGFTLNWGADTSKVSEDLVYDGRAWSFDALFNVANSGGIVKDGEMAIPYIYNDKKSTIDDEGNVTIVLDYDSDVTEAADVDYDSISVAINMTIIDDEGNVDTFYDTMAGDFIVSGEVDKTNHTVTATFSAADLCAYQGVDETTVSLINSPDYQGIDYVRNEDGSIKTREVKDEETGDLVTYYCYYPYNLLFAQYKALLLSSKGSKVSLSFKVSQTVTINGISGSYSVPLTGSSSSFGIN